MGGGFFSYNAVRAEIRRKAGVIMAMNSSSIDSGRQFHFESILRANIVEAAIALNQRESASPTLKIPTATNSFGL